MGVKLAGSWIIVVGQTAGIPGVPGKIFRSPLIPTINDARRTDLRGVHPGRAALAGDGCDRASRVVEVAKQVCHPIYRPQSDIVAHAQGHGPAQVDEIVVNTRPGGIRGNHHHQGSEQKHAPFHYVLPSFAAHGGPSTTGSPDICNLPGNQERLSFLCVAGRTRSQQAPQEKHSKYPLRGRKTVGRSAEKEAAIGADVQDPFQSGGATRLSRIYRRMTIPSIAKRLPNIDRKGVLFCEGRNSEVLCYACFSLISLYCQESLPHTQQQTFPAHPQSGPLTQPRFQCSIPASIHKEKQ